MKTIISKSEIETHKLAENLTKTFTGNAVIGLIGDLGAGKTAFTKGLASGLNIKNKITSPTFVFMKVYDVLKNSKIKKFVHIDAYRISSEADMEAIGAPEYFERPDTITVVEWADNLKNILPQETKYIEFKSIDENTREIKFLF